MSVPDTGAVDSIPIFFLIDTTSSMKGEAIDAVNSSLRICVDQVKKRSFAAASNLSLSLIGFDGEARVILPPTLLRNVDLPRIEASDSGATLLAGALQLAVELVPDHQGVDDQLKPILVILLDGLPQDGNSVEFTEWLDAVMVKFGEKFVFAALPISKQSKLNFLIDSTTFSDVCDTSFVESMFRKVIEYCFDTFHFDHVDPELDRADALDIRPEGVIEVIDQLTTKVVEQTVEADNPTRDNGIEEEAIEENAGPITAKPDANRWVPEWLPPYGTGGGIRCVNKSLYLSSGIAPNGAELEFKVSHLPIVGMYSFLAASRPGYPPVCLAIPRRNGALAISFSENKADLTWQIFETELDHHTLPDSSLPLESWSAAILDNKDEHLRLLIPSDEGPCVVDLDLVKRLYTTELAEGRCLGGVAKINSSAYVPVFRNDKLEIAFVNAGVWTYWTLEDYMPADAPIFGCPIVIEPRRTAIWISKAGYLLMKGGRISFNVWPEGWSARTEFGPPFESAEGYWQLCFNPSMDTYKYGYILIDRPNHQKNPVIKTVDGPRLSTGSICVSKKSIYKNAPWDKKPEQFGVEAFIFPMLQLQNELLYVGVNPDSSPETTSMTSVMESEENYHFNIRAKSSGIPLMAGRGLTPWRGSFFVFGDRLNFYSETQGEICSWIIQK